MTLRSSRLWAGGRRQACSSDRRKGRVHVSRGELCHMYLCTYLHYYVECIPATRKGGPCIDRSSKFRS